MEPNQRLLFLETTIQIDRVIGTQERRDMIRSNLRGRTLCTSHHVLGEFNRTLLRDAIVFRDLLRNSADVADAVKRLPRYIYSERKYHRTVDLLASLGFDQDKQNTLDRLEKFIEWQAHDCFWESVQQSSCPNEVGCVLQTWLPVKGDSGAYDLDGLKCLKDSPPPCAILAFIEKHRAILTGFASAAQTQSRPNVVKAGRAFEAILQGQDTPYGERSNCYVVADTLIVLEAPQEVEMYSTDGDVHIICEILARPRYSEIPA